MVHTLTFSNITATFAKDKDLVGNQDPYIVFELGNTRTQTKAIKGAGTRAVWKDSYTLDFDSSSSSSELIAVAYNHNTLLPDGLLGTGKINLNSLDEGSFSGSSTSIPLYDKKGGNIGELNVSINGGGHKGRSTSSTTGSTGAATGAMGAGAAVGATGAGTRSNTREADLTKDNYSGTGVTNGSTATRGTNVGTNVMEGDRSQYTTGNTTGEMARDAEGNVIDRKYYTSVEDRPVDQELVEQYREHNPYEKQYKTTVQATGRERQLNSNVEALGTQERVIGVDNVVSADPRAVLERHLPPGYHNERPGGEGWVEGKPGPICEEKDFVVAGDRPVEKERVTALQEHRDFEKEFEAKTRLEGERQVATGVQPEMLDRQRNVVGVHTTTPCEGHPEI